MATTPVPCDVYGCPNHARWYYPNLTLFSWNLCDTCKDTDPRGVDCRLIEEPNWEFRARRLFAAGHGVRFIVTIQNGLHVDVHAERIEYDHVGPRRHELAAVALAAQFEKLVRKAARAGIAVVARAPRQPRRGRSKPNRAGGRRTRRLPQGLSGHLEFDFYSERGMVDPAWFAKHTGHRIVARNEYGAISNQCGSHETCTKCGHRFTCNRSPGHTGEHHPNPEPR